MQEDSTWNAFLASSPAAAPRDDVTGAVPSLGDLAEADELEDEDHPARSSIYALDYDNVTAAVPGLGAVLEEDEEEEGDNVVDMEMTVAIGGVSVEEQGNQEEEDDEIIINTAAAAATEEEHQQEEEAEEFFAAAAPAPIAAPAEDAPPVIEEGDVLPPATQDQQQQQQQQQQVENGVENAVQRQSSPTFTFSSGSGGGGGGTGGQQQQEGQANKWGFVPGDDDTMELDLEGHGRAMMGDRTYAGLYGDGVTGRTVLMGGGDGGDGEEEEETEVVESVNAVVKSPVAAAAVGAAAEEDEPAAQQPNWAMPAFLPPYLAGTAAATADGGDGNLALADHPALHHSPAFTNSSLNTMSTRRVSVDVRRASVTSRRASAMTGGSLFGGGGAGDTAATGGGVDNNNNTNTIASPGGGQQLSDVTEDLLADDDDDDLRDDAGGGGGDGNLLAGLQHQVRLLSKGGSPSNAPAVAAAAAASSELKRAQHHQQQQQHSSSRMILENDDDDEVEPSPDILSGDAAGGAAHAVKTPFSVGYADSSFNPATAALLRTGGTTDLLADTAEGATIAENDRTRGTNATHGTTRLLRMDATASSAIAAGAKMLLNGDDDVDDVDEDNVTAPIVSPTRSAHHKMTHSPPASALSSGSLGRHLQQHHQQQYPYQNHHPGLASVLRGSPAVMSHPTRRASVLHQIAAQTGGHVTPGTLQRHHQRMATHVTPGGGGGSIIINPSATGGHHGPYAAPPGSAIAARYPGSAVAQGRLSQGFTPSLAPPITFQDFAKIVEVQFLDNLRRGSSINYADLAPNPVPSTLADAYTLLCVTSPNLAELETAVHTLRSEASRLRASASELEVMLGGSNPPIFRHVQIASMEQLDAFRANVGLLKKVCRAKAVVLLKDVRCQMEDSKAGRLARAADGLKTDLGYVQEQARHTSGVAAAAEKFAEETRAQLALEAEARVVESERRRRVAAARAALEESRHANALRCQRLEEAVARGAELKRERHVLATEREQLHAAADEARSALAKLSSIVVAGGGGDPRAVLAQLQSVARLEACLGLKVEQSSAANGGGGGVVLSLRVGPIFRLRVAATPAGVRGTIEVVSESARERFNNSSSSSSAAVTGAAQRSLAAAVAGVSTGGGGGGSEAFFVDASGAPAAVQTTVAHLQRCSDLAAELRGVRAACRHLCEVTAAGGAGSSARGGVCLLYSGLDADVRFAVTLTPGPVYPLGALPVQTKIYFDGDGQVTAADVAAAVAQAPAGPGRIRAVCAELSDLVDKMAPKSASHLAYRTAFGNPLFGGSSGTAAAAAVV